MGKIEQACRHLQEEGISYSLHTELKKYTTLHIGGRADILCEPSSVHEIASCLKICHDNDIPWYLLGNGSNMLISDDGYRGMIIVTATNFHMIRLLDEHHVAAYSGAPIRGVSAFCAKHGLSGLEFACGIPGSVGGAVFMNAGAYGGEIAYVLKQVTWMDVQGTLHENKVEDLAMNYRHSMFKDHQGIIIEAVFQLEHGEATDIQKRMDELMQKRRDKQPLEMYSAGSTFQRPKGNYASALIQQAGLMGYRVHDAQVSTKHAGFLVNRGNASCQDFLKLIHEVQKRVRQNSGYELECEVKYL